MSVDPKTVYKSLKDAIPELVKEADYSELYGLDFAPTAEWTAAHEKVLYKFVKANNNELEGAKAQLLKTLQWRKEFKPLDSVKETHSPELEKLGVITKSPSGKVITWNLYGAIKNRQDVFGKLDAFLRWRVSLMERGIAQLDLDSEELSTMDQVHDYMDVSFLRMDKETKAASSQTIKLFQDYYPEFLSKKYFVNVPYIMTWVFALAKAFMSKETAAKMTIIGNGKDLKYELGDWIPAAYGGRAKDFVSITAESKEAAKEPSKLVEEESPAEAATEPVSGAAAVADAKA